MECTVLTALCHPPPDATPCGGTTCSATEYCHDAASNDCRGKEASEHAAHLPSRCLHADLGEGCATADSTQCLSCLDAATSEPFGTACRCTGSFDLNPQSGNDGLWCDGELQLAALPWLPHPVPALPWLLGCSTWPIALLRGMP